MTTRKENAGDALAQGVLEIAKELRSDSPALPALATRLETLVRAYGAYPARDTDADAIVAQALGRTRQEEFVR